MDVLWHQTDTNSSMSSQVKLMSWHYGLGRRQAVSHDEIRAVGNRVSNLKLNKRMWCQPCHQLTSYCRLVSCQGSCKNWRNKEKLLAPMYWWVVLLCRMYKRAWVNQKTCAVQANSLLIHCRWITFGMFDSWGSVELLPSWLFLLFIL